VTRGTGTYYVEGQRVPLRSGTALWLAPGVEHQLHEVSADYHMWVIVFGDKAFECAHRTVPSVLNLARGTFETASLARPAIGNIARIAYTLMRHREGPTYVERLAHVLSVAFRECDRALESRPLLHPAIRRACRTIEATAETDLCLDELAARVELSPSRLTHLFSAELGLPPSHYLQHVRVQRAVGSLATDPTTTLLRAAFNAGFGSYVQFFRAFRVVTGLSPSAYERQVARGIIPLRSE
jgi:AraC family transcriptional regulator of arabinose operon